MFSNARIQDRVLWVTMLLLAVFSACTARADQTRVFRVDYDVAGSMSSGDSWKNSCSDLQVAINAAFDAGGGEVWVKAGVYKPTGKNRGATYELKPGVKLYGGFRGTEQTREERNPKANRTVLNGDIGAIGIDDDNCYHVVTGATDTILDGFIISRGNADSIGEQAQGGGLDIPKGTKQMVVANCTFEKNNATWQGGAIYAERSELSLTNCTFFSNAATSGGAVSVNGESTLSIVDAFFSANTAQTAAGAINLEDETHAVINRCHFMYNTSQGNAGALAAITQKGSLIELVLSDCVFANNMAKKNGGAVYISGEISPVVKQCSFERNSSFTGGGAIGNAAGASTVVQECAFANNRGRKGMADVGTDDSSKVFDNPEALAEQQLPKPEVAATETKPQKKLADVKVYNNDNAKIKLRGIVGAKKYTLLVLGDLTDPDFIKNYRNIEAAAQAYRSFDIQFFYIYRALLHPENNGYIQPFFRQERARQTQLAASLLLTGIPWLYDCMDNQAVKDLAANTGKNAFLYSADGTELFAGSLSDSDALQSALEHIVGLTMPQTSANRISSPRISPLNIQGPELLDRIHFDPETEPFSPLRIEPMDSRMPFYVKLRAEGNDKLLNSGNGKLYLGFDIDPLYQMQWDNKAAPLQYTVKAEVGLAAPTTDHAPEIDTQPTDTEPREFVLNARQLDLAKPLVLKVSYTVFSPTQNRKIEVSQGYLVHLEKDPYGGAAYRRQIAHKDPPRKRNNVTMPSALRQHDANGDGKLTRGELSGNLWSKFPEMDTNKDGYLSASEYSDYLQSR